MLAASAGRGPGLDFTGPAAANLRRPRRHRWAARQAAGRRCGGRTQHLGRRPDRRAGHPRHAARAGRPVDVSASCSLLHVPLDVRLERDLDPQLAGWFSFARQKLDEIVTLAQGSAPRVATPSPARARRSTDPTSPPERRSPIVRGPGRARPGRRGHATPTCADRAATPSGAQPSGTGCTCRLLPTTTIGSFPQTAELRRPGPPCAAGTLDRAGLRRGGCGAEIAQVIAARRQLGLDVLVHGEPERNDMVQYFAEQLAGFVATEHGWVQSYGTRYVRPPIIVGDVSRPAPMTVDGPRYAQSLTDPPGQGHAHRAGDDAGLVLRPRRPAAGRHRPAGRAGAARRGRRPGGGRYRGHPGRRTRAARDPAAARRPTGRATWGGRSTRSAWPPAGFATTPRSTPTCATPSSATC